MGVEGMGSIAMTHKNSRKGVFFNSIVRDVVFLLVLVCNLLIY